MSDLEIANLTLNYKSSQLTLINFLTQYPVIHTTVRLLYPIARPWDITGSDGEKWIDQRCNNLEK